MYPTLICRGKLRGGTTWKLSKKTVETGRNNEADGTEKIFEIAEEEQDLEL